MIDLSSALKSLDRVKVQAYWDPIEDSTSNLHQPTQEWFYRMKERRLKQNLPELVDMTWEQALELFNLKPAHRLMEYGSSDFQAFLPPSAVSVEDIWELDSEGILPFLRQFHPCATMEF